MFSNNNKKTNSTTNGKEMLWDYLGLLGKVFLAGAAVCGAYEAITDADNAKKEFNKKHLGC